MPYNRPLNVLPSQGHPVPDPHDITSVDLSRVNWILVVEKKVALPPQKPLYPTTNSTQATFHTLSQIDFPSGVSSGGILLTGQGYPDLLTRSFIHHLHAVAPHIPMYCLVDYDLDGLAIYTTYAFGSESLAHERDLAVPDMRLLGLKSADLVPIVKKAVKARTTQDESPGSAAEVGSGGTQEWEAEFPALRERERRLAITRLARWCKGIDEKKPEAGRMAELRRETQVMLTLGLKAETQILDQRDGGLERWCRVKLRHY